MIKAWITDYLGALLRFIYYKYVKRKKVIYSNFLSGVNTPRTKVDKALYDNNYGKNRMWCAVFLLILENVVCRFSINLSWCFRNMFFLIDYDYQ